MTAQRTVALAATLGTLAALSRVPFAVVPSVQPASALIILAGAALGWRVGALTGAVVPLVSNAFLGHGPWTPFQMAAWAAMGAGAAALGPRAPRWSLAAYGAVAGLAYGLVMDGWVWLFSVRPLALHTLVPVLARGLPFNLAHAGGNAVILWLVGQRLLTLLGRAEAKRVVERMKAAEVAGRGGGEDTEDAEEPGTQRPQRAAALPEQRLRPPREQARGKVTENP